MVKSLQESILLCDFRDFIEAFDFIDSFAIQSQSDYNIILDQISLWRFMVKRPHLKLCKHYAG